MPTLLETALEHLSDLRLEPVNGFIPGQHFRARDHSSGVRIYAMTGRFKHFVSKTSGVEHVESATLTSYSLVEPDHFRVKDIAQKRVVRLGHIFKLMELSLRGQGLLSLKATNIIPVEGFQGGVCLVALSEGSVGKVGWFIDVWREADLTDWYGVAQALHLSRVIMQSRESA